MSRQFTHQELAALMKKCAGLTVDPAALAGSPEMTFTEFGRATLAGAELLFSRSPSAKPSDPYFSPQSLWGKSKDELFLTISDEEFERYACGAAFVVWFDGAKFHQF